MRTTVKPIPAPVRGWNARDSIASMKEGFAIILDNWFPGFGKCTMRKGYSEYATTLGGNVWTLAEFHAGTTRKFIAAANGNIWDISSSGAGSSLDSGYTEDKWQYAMMNSTMGLVNGTDSPITFDGSSVAAMTVSGSGLTTSDLININVHRTRSYFIEKNTLSFWYSAVNTLGGSLTEFDLSRVTNLGGNLIAMGTWTRDGGNGMDDLAVFVTSSGQVIIYQGSNPGDADNWSLIGVYHIGAPIGYRCFVKAGPDLVLITKEGFVPLSTTLGDRVGGYKISDNIVGAVIEAGQNYSGNDGWQGLIYPRGGYAVFNIPIASTTFHQYVVNIKTGAWCRFKNQNGRCWGLFNDRLYFGGSGSVYLADDGYDDNTANIEVDGQTAFSYFKSPNNQKLFSGLRPLISSEGGVAISTAMAIDFDDPSSEFIASPSVIDGAEWDVAEWDEEFWAGGANVARDWLGAEGLGYSASVRLRVRTKNQPVSWFSTDFMYQVGGFL